MRSPPPIHSRLPARVAGYGVKITRSGFPAPAVGWESGRKCTLRSARQWRFLTGIATSQTLTSARRSHSARRVGSCIKESAGNEPHHDIDVSETRSQGPSPISTASCATFQMNRSHTQTRGSRGRSESRPDGSGWAPGLLTRADPQWYRPDLETTRCRRGSLCPRPPQATGEVAASANEQARHTGTLEAGSDLDDLPLVHAERPAASREEERTLPEGGTRDAMRAATCTLVALSGLRPQILSRDRCRPPSGRSRPRDEREYWD